MSTAGEKLGLASLFVMTPVGVDSFMEPHQGFTEVSGAGRPAAVATSVR